MKFLIDAQLPPALAAWIRAKDHEAMALRDIGLRDAPDTLIWDHAIANGIVIVTKDDDFPLMAEARPGPQILWVRAGNLVNRILLRQFEKAWADVMPLLESGITVVELR